MRIDLASPRLMTLILAGLVAIPSLPPGAADPVADRQESKPAEATNTDSRDRSASAIVRAAKTRTSASKDPVKVYTNEDLDRVWAGSREPRDEPRESASSASRTDPRTSTAGGQAIPDPLQAMQQQQARRVDDKRRVAEAEAEAVRAAERVKSIENRLRLLRNPLLGRAAPPDEPAAEGAEEWSELDGAARVQRSEQELLEAREELKNKRMAVERLRRPS